jgi:MFS superfamily sulfate permease-like transporter
MNRSPSDLAQADRSSSPVGQTPQHALTRMPMRHRFLFTHVLRDVSAGIVVFLVALPLCLAIAQAAGVSPLAGLISGVVGGIVVTLLSGSRLSVSGPAAGLIVIVTDSIAELGGYGEFLLAVLLSGLIQYGFGLLRAGRFAAYVPSAVIKGMLAGIGLLLIIKQAPLAIGLVSGADSAPGFAPMLTAFLITGISLLVLIAWDQPALRRFALVRLVPAPLLVVKFGILATLALDAWHPAFAPPAAHRVILPELASFEALGTMIEHAQFGVGFEQLLNPVVWRVALTLAIVASLETLLNLEAVVQLDPERRPMQADRELRAQGVGNLVAGALGGLPVTSVIVRSSVNVAAGARSRLSAIVHGVLLLVSVFALTSILNLIPLACLAAILIYTGLKLAKPSLFASIARLGPAAFLPFIATIAGVIALDLLSGVALGIVFSILAMVSVNLRSVVTLARHDDHYLLTFRKDVWFLVKVQVKRMLGGIPEHSYVTIDATRVDYIDHDIRDLIEEFVADAPGRGITVEYLEPTHPTHTGSRRWRAQRIARNENAC